MGEVSREAEAGEPRAATIIDVAAYVLEHFDQPVSPMKLQKLLYLAQGWNLAITGKPLFDSPFEAWSSGPVNRELYELLQGEYTVTSSSFRQKLRERFRRRSSPEPVTI